MRPANLPRALPAADNHDVIFRMETPPGAGGLTVFLLDGPETSARLREHFLPATKGRFERYFRGAYATETTSKTTAKTRGENQTQIFLGRLAEAGNGPADAIPADEVLWAPIPAERSFTGNEQIELSCHGGGGAAAAVAELFHAVGFRPAQPAEPEIRAYRAGKISLPALEARLRWSGVVTTRQTELLLGTDVFARHWREHGERLAAVAAREPALLAAELQTTAQRARSDLACAQSAQRLLRAHALVLIGLPNAGKSALTNFWAKAERRLVDETPGSTRDAQTLSLDILGLDVRWTDSAGVTTTNGGPEPVVRTLTAAMHQNALTAAAQADWAAAVVDGSHAPTKGEKTVLRGALREAGRPVLPFITKADLPRNAEAEAFAASLSSVPPVRMSALTGWGADETARRLAQLFLDGEFPEPGAPFTQRQRQCLVSLLDDANALDADAALEHIRKLLGVPPAETQLAAAWREMTEGG
jgi:tRNA modification GTPase